MERGYLKLWRKSIDSPVFANDALWKLWCWCLMRTTYKTRHVSMRIGKGEKTITLQPGQFIYGRNSAAKDLRESPSTIRNRMKKLTGMDMIKLEKDTQYSIVSICNWEEYQANDDELGQSKDSLRTDKGQSKDTNKKGNKGKKDKNTIGGDSFNPFTVKPDWFPEQAYTDLVDHRRKKKSAESNRAYSAILKQIQIAIEAGFSVDDCVDSICSRDWKGFKAAWMKDSTGHSGNNGAGNNGYTGTGKRIQ